MGWFDVVIPAGSGLLAVFAPQHWFTKRTADPVTFARAARICKTAGVVILAAAGLLKIGKLIAGRY